MNANQPRALYLADVLCSGFECDLEWYELEAARELRRLHAENEALQAGYEAARLEIDSKRQQLLQAIVAEIEALPVRSTGYPPFQHSPDWMRQQAADVVRQHMEGQT